ncbi:MAG: hypothetical protein M3Z26_12090 [Bacteroidota bacterium]|nr:hypothetical protein [Bacteroidota bacterium]
MKHIYKVLLLSCVAITVVSIAKAQNPTSTRKDQFSKLSERLPVAVSELDKAFIAPEGTKVQLIFSNFSFSGIITSSVKRYDNLYSVVIKSSSPDNTLFSISKRINDDQSISYVGRIINEKYADGYELRKESNGTYSMNKIKTEVLIQDY